MDAKVESIRLCQRQKARWSKIECKHRLFLLHCLAVLGSDMRLLIWGSRHKPEKKQGAMMAAAVMLGVHALFAAIVWVLKPCCDRSQDE